MKRPPAALPIACLALGAALFALSHRAGPHAPPRVAVAGPTARPLAFERNDGQTDAQVRFVARGSGGAVFVTGDGLTIAPRGAGRPPLRLAFDGASAERVDGGERLPGVANYVIGRDRSKWLANVPLFARAVCRGVWPGIDVVFHGDASRVEYDFELSPGADPNAVALRFDGADSVAVDDAGDLLVRTGTEEFRHLRPRVLQDGRDLDGAFVARGGGRVGFRVDGRDAALALVIDPVIAYATYLGGRDAESTSDVSVDSQGDVFVTGSVSSVDFPVANALPGAPGAGGTDAFVTKLNPSGATLLYSTYFGGGGTDVGWGIRADSTGIYLAGSTTSSDFPAVGAYQSTFEGGLIEGDAFLVKLTPSGDSVTYSTLLGGTGDDGCRGLALDAAGNAYLGGFTTSTDFPVSSAAPQKALRGTTDGWAAKIGPTGAVLLWSTYFGGTAADVINDIVFDATGRLFVAGFTASYDLPASGGYQLANNGGGYDGFVAKFNPQGTFLVCTYLGGTENDGCRRIKLDSAGRPHVAGYTLSDNFPTKNPVQQILHGGAGAGDGFVAAFDTGLTTLVFSTYLGGNANDDIQGLAIGPDDSVFVTGNTTSFTFPLLNPVQVGIGGLRDAFVTKLSPAGADMVWSTFCGGAGYDSGGAITVNSSGDAYVSMSAGAGDLTTRCASQPVFAGGEQDCYVVKFTDDASEKPARPLSPVATASSPYRVVLTWTDASGNECSFRVERREGNGPFVTLGTPDTNVTTFEDATVLPDRKYAYRVFAVNPLGESDPSDEAVITAPQTIIIAQRKGSLLEANGSRRDRITFMALLRFVGASVDHTLRPIDEGLRLAVGDGDDPVVIDIAAHDRRWKRSGTHRFTWTSPRKAKPQVRIVLELGAAASLSVTMSRLDFPTTPNGAIFVSMHGGDDGGSTLRNWTARKKKPGQFKLP